MRAAECLGHTRVAGRRLAVLGDMLELGDRAPALHEETGVLVVQSGVQELITFGPLAQHMAQGARCRHATYYSIPRRKRRTLSPCSNHCGVRGT